MPTDLKNVLIITTGFPPMNNVSARRFGGMVQYMEEFGWRPWVVTLGSQGSLPVNIPESQIVHIGWANQVGDRIAEPDSQPIPLFLSFFRKVVRKSGCRLYSVNTTLFGWYKQVIARTDLIDNLGKMDLVLASFGPPAALWLGRYFSSRYHVPWVADFRDLGAICDDSRPRVARLVDMLIEKYLLHTAVGITTVGNQLARMLMDVYHKPVKPVFNGYWFYDQRSSEQVPPRGMHSTRFIYYAGQFYDHRLNALEVVFSAIRRFSGLSLVIRSVGPSYMERKVVECMKRLGVADQVEILPACAPDIVIRESQMSLCNLVVEDLDMGNQRSRGTVTGKLLELLPLVPPVLAVARPDSEIGSILSTTNKGKLCSSEDQVVDFLDRILKGDEFLGNQDRILYFSKRSQCRELCGFLDEMVK